MQPKLSGDGYHFRVSVVSMSLAKLSIGKDAVLLKKGKKRNHTYYERCPPAGNFWNFHLVNSLLFLFFER